MPLLSKVCPLCGHVMEGDDKAAVEQINRMEQILHDLKALRKPSFLKSMENLSIFMAPVLTVLILLMYLMSKAGLFMILLVLFAVWSVVLFVKKAKGKLGNEESVKRYTSLKNDYEHIMRVVEREWGKNREMSKLLADIKSQIESIDRERKAATRNNIIVWACVCGAIVLLASLGSVGVKNTVEENVANEWKARMEAFEAEGVNDEYNSEPRIQLIKLALQADAIVEVENFYHKFCNGLMGDFDCARIIVEYHLKNGNKEAAEAFVSKCKLRYASDMKKLENLIK